MELRQTAECINRLGRFCGPRDVSALTPGCLRERFGWGQADVMVLFGGSILCGGDVLAQAMQNGAAKTYILVGGAGHTTETLRREAHRRFPELETDGLPEAEVFARYLNFRYGLKADYLECRSTNCGNNITFLLALLREKRIDSRSLILCQDATMQRRMTAGLHKYAPERTVINYAAYRTDLIVREGKLAFADSPLGMWEVERYAALLMGEIPRLTDDTGGYGPEGKNFIAHVEIPEEVREAFDRLRESGAFAVRRADPRFASADTEDRPSVDGR